MISGKEYRCYTVSVYRSHREFKLIKYDTEQLQNKQKKGGQSAPRFSRIREEKYNWYISKISNIIMEIFMTDNHTKCTIEGLILAGPCSEKNDVFKNNLIQQYFANKIICVTETAEISDETIYDVYNKCSTNIASDVSKYENKICNDIDELISVASDLLLFGDEVIKGIDEYKIKQVIYSSNLKDEWKLKIQDTKKYNYDLIEIKNLNNIQKLPCELIGITYY